MPLLDLVVAEAFEAAIDVAGQENLDVRLHEMRYAMPPLKVQQYCSLSMLVHDRNACGRWHKRVNGCNAPRPLIRLI